MGSCSEPPMLLSIDYALRKIELRELTIHRCMIELMKYYCKRRVMKILYFLFKILCTEMSHFLKEISL